MMPASPAPSQTRVWSATISNSCYVYQIAALPRKVMVPHTFVFMRYPAQVPSKHGTVYTWHAIFEQDFSSPERLKKARYSETIRSWSSSDTRPCIWLYLQLWPWRRGRLRMIHTCRIIHATVSSRHSRARRVEANRCIEWKKSLQI